MSTQHGAGPLVVDPGTVFGFRTSPYFENSPPDTGRYGAFVVLTHTEDLVALGVLDGVWSAMPTVDEMQDCALLRRNRFFFTGQVAAFGCAVDDDPDLAELTVIGQLPLSAEQQRIAAKYLDADNRVGTSVGSADGVSVEVEGEWRWAHDRAALQHEYELREQRREQARAAAQERYDTRLKDLTWEQLLTERPFQRWDPCPPFPPPEFRDAATARVYEAYRSVQALGVKPRKPAVRKILKDLVVWFNDADDRAGGVIETEEREDISLVLEEITHVARHPSLLEEADAWREW